MLDDLIDKYTTILDRDPLDHSESTDVILEAFAREIIEQTIRELKQDKYYKAFQENLMDNRLDELMYKSGLTASGCWDNLDDYDKKAIENGDYFNNQI